MEDRWRKHIWGCIVDRTLSLLNVNKEQFAMDIGYSGRSTVDHWKLDGSVPSNKNSGKRSINKDFIISTILEYNENGNILESLKTYVYDTISGMKMELIYNFDLYCKKKGIETPLIEDALFSSIAERLYKCNTLKDILNDAYFVSGCSILPLDNQADFIHLENPISQLELNDNNGKLRYSENYPKPKVKIIEDIVNGAMNNVVEFYSNDSIVSEKRLAQIEMNGQYKDIWIITADLYGDTNNTIFESIVRENIKKNVKYTYFIPENNYITKGRSEQIMELYEYSDCLRFIELDTEFFFLVPSFDFVLYNPIGGKGYEKFGYMCLSIYSQNGMLYSKVNENLISAFVGRLKKKYGELLNY